MTTHTQRGFTAGIGIILALVGGAVGFFYVRQAPPETPPGARSGTTAPPTAIGGSGATGHSVPPSSVSLNSVSLNSVSLNSVSLERAPDLAADSAEADGWQTETLNERLNVQLKALAKAIAASDTAAVRSLLLGTAQVEGLPRRPEPAHRPGTPPTAANLPAPAEPLRVQRQLAGDRRVSGAAAAAVLVKLRHGPIAGPVHIKFKLDGIQQAGDSATIHVRVTSEWQTPCATTACPLAERHSTWRMGWQRVGARYLIRSVQVGAATLATTTSGALFEDITGAVLAPVADQAILLADADTWLRRVDNARPSDPIGHQGIAIADVNGDGLDDVYLSAPAGLPNRLLIQQADGTVVDQALKAGVAILDLSRSALFADFDGDGDQDLVVAVRYREAPAGTAVLLFAGDGHAHFAAPKTILRGGDVHSLAAADVDSDGDLDLYACLLNADKRIEGGFGVPMPYHDATNGGHNVLLENRGGLVFTDVTRAVGLSVNNSRWSYAAAWEDYDNDGDPDLYVANDFGRNNLYRNDKGHFTDVAAAAGVEDIAAGMSVSWGDIDRDGDMDLYVSNMYSSAGRRIAAQPRFLKGADAETRRAFLHHAQGNSLFRNNGDGTFTDIAATAGASVAKWAWGSLLADLDGDGWQDAMVVNGMFTRSNEHDL